MHDVADKVGNAGMIGAIAAAIAAIALACRSRGAKMDRGPVGFPSDPNMALQKYQNAYSQLVTESATASELNKERPVTAIDYALIAFEEAKGASQIDSGKRSGAATSPGKIGGD